MHKLFKKINCLFNGHKWGEWIFVRVTMPDFQPKEYNTCKKCGKVISRYFKDQNKLT